MQKIIDDHLIFEPSSIRNDSIKTLKLKFGGLIYNLYYR